MNSFVRNQLKKVNAMLNRWMTKREKEIAFPKDVELIADVPYLSDGKPCHRMDIYRPRNASAPLPVIVDIHGGGMVLCTKEVNRIFCAELAKRGFLVFCLEYPLVPEADIPTIIADISRGMDAANEMLATCGGDPGRVYMVGDSAGGFLSVYATAARSNSELAAAVPTTPSSLPVKALGLISGMFYTTGFDSVGLFLRKDFYGSNWKRHPMSKFYHPDCPDVAGNLPPCFLITSGSDNLRAYTMKFRKGLQRAGTHRELLYFPLGKNLQHDFIVVTPEKADAQLAIDRMCDFLLQY